MLPASAAFDVCTDRKDRTLSLLTWNIFMMPPWVRESPRNVARADVIAMVLEEQAYDLVCLQKVFDSAARDMLAKRLSRLYPYRYGPANDAPSLELNSGVWVLSKHALTNHREIEFDECSGIECLSRKGAMLLSGRCGATPFHLISTHLQGEEGNAFTEKNQRVRLAQVRAIRERLLVPATTPGVPILVCGDLGTPRFELDGTTETAPYRELLSILGASSGPEPRITLDETPAGSQLVKDGSGRQNELDYVLLCANGAHVSVERERRIFRRAGWDSESGGWREDLSYRYAVEARVTFGG